VRAHAPQLFESCVSEAQYAGASGGQAVWPVEQVWTHPCALHTVPAAHDAPQAPQFAGSVAKLVQNAVWPVPHASGALAGQAQLPFVHC
jgi:hypothetical protein